MHNRILFKLMFIFFLLVLAGCSKLNEEDDYFKGTMQARINGELVIFDEAYGDRRLSWEDFTWSGIINIVGLTDQRVSGYEIQIGFPNNPSTGILYHPHCMYRPWIGNYHEYRQTAYITKSEDAGNQYSSSTLTFTSVDNKKYTGTFSFTAYIVDSLLKDSVVVTEGKFEIDSGGKKF
ncbi:hypothetical protein BA6E_1216 [Bacteroidales bacterium 6E]|nr:hypothetical protein BA6E_1216 [Bacteroidales bacterium 6E]